MKTTLDHIREFLIGRSCTGVVVQRYWYESVLEDEASVLFLQVGPAKWARLWIDAPDLFLREVDSPDCAADFEMPPGCSCDLQAVEDAAPIIGQTIKSVDLVDFGDEAQE